MGVLQQALLDLSDWVEKGIVSPSSSRYEVVDGQVILPETAKERKGIQPVISLIANGASRAEVKVGEAVSFAATIALPENTGEIVDLEWDFNEDSQFVQASKSKSDKTNFQITAEHAYNSPETYFVALRATSQRNGDVKTPFAKIRNLGRVRVVVR